MSEVYYTSQVEKLEADKEAKKQELAYREAIQRLLKNPDFNTVIVEGFCGRECVRYIEQSTSPNLDEAGRKNSLVMAQSGGHLRRFLALAQQMSSTVERDIQAIEYELEQARAEEGAV